ncbi:MAG TPA: hypothetical protein VGJ39_09250 [Vicinamibacterales bacterium]
MQNYSGTYRRVWQQYGAAVRSRPSAPGEPVSVLIVGNSLLLEGIDVERLQRSTSRSLRIYPVFLEGTHYFDWLYGLRRLFRQGARPQVLVVGLGMESVVQNAVRPDYSPMLLFDTRDVVDVSSDLGLDRTATFNLLLSHWSVFWNMRRVIRVQILRRAIPDARELFTLYKKMPGNRIGPEFEAVATTRLRMLRQLGETYGARVVLLIPPWSTSPDAVRELIAAAQEAGLDRLMPLNPSEVPAADYEDTIHLNATGTALFTAALATDLPRKIEALAAGAHPHSGDAGQSQRDPDSP